MNPVLDTNPPSTSSALPVLFGLSAVGCLLSGLLPLSDYGDGKLFDGGFMFVVATLLPASLLLLAALSPRRNADMAGLGGGAALAAVSMYGSFSAIILKTGNFSHLGAGTYMMMGTTTVGLIAVFASIGSRPASGGASPALWLGLVAAFVLSLGCTLVPDEARGTSWVSWNHFGEGYEPVLAVAAQVLLWVPTVALLVAVAKKGRFGALFATGGVSILVWFVGAFHLSKADRFSSSVSALQGYLHPLATVGAVAVVITVIAAIVASAPPTSVTAGAAVVNPPRWASDPFGRHEMRYWDGRGWTDQVADAGKVATDPPVATQTAPAFAVPVVLPMPSVGAVRSPETINDELNRTIPRVPASSLPAATSAAPTYGAEVLFDDGRRVTLSAPIIIGRSPIAIANVASATLFPIDDPTMSVSSTHLVIGCDASGLWAQDTGSTNGSSVTLSSGQTVELLPGVRSALDSGAQVKFGERSLEAARIGKVGSDLVVYVG